MDKVSSRWRTRLAVALALATAFASAEAFAFEALDGRIQAHGFFESQFRALNADFGEDWDVAQWYQVFNLELEFDILQDTIGPVDLVSGLSKAVESKLGERGLEVEARESIFAHLQRGAPVGRLDREYGQDLGRQAVSRIQSDIAAIAGKLLGKEYPSSDLWTTHSLNNLPKRQFRWDIYQEINKPFL